MQALELRIRKLEKHMKAQPAQEWMAAREFQVKTTKTTKQLEYFRLQNPDMVRPMPNSLGRRYQYNYTLYSKTFLQ